MKRKLEGIVIGNKIHQEGIAAYHALLLGSICTIIDGNITEGYSCIGESKISKNLNQWLQACDIRFINNNESKILNDF